MIRSHALCLALIATIIGASSSNATTVITSSAPDFDRWNYPFNATPGVRTAAPTFGAVGDPLFDDRDGQFIVGFDVAGSLPYLLPGQRYEVTEAIVTATHSTGTFAYDPTYDSYQTYDGTTTDSDAGRPIVLTGAGTRSAFGFIGYSTSPFVTDPPFYLEDTAFAFADPTLPGVRLAYATDATGTDISNNVTDGFDFTPFAVGQATSGIAPGDNVTEGVIATSAGETFEFGIDVSDADIQDYLVNSLSSGLYFTISSLHSASEQQGGANPSFYTSDNADPAAIAPTLSITIAVVPEPTTATLGLGSIAAGLLGFRRRR